MIAELVKKEDIPLIMTLEIAKHECDEIIAFCGIDPKETLRQSLEKSKYSWWGYDEVEGRVLGAGGVYIDPLYETMGVCWLLVAENAYKDHLPSIVTLATKYLDFCFNTLNLDSVANYVALNNKKSLKWIKYMGFEFMGQPKRFYDKNVLFDKFYMFKEDFNNVHRS